MKNCKQIATEWGLSERTVNDLCKKNKIDGAIKVGKMWKIPDDAKKPIDGRITSGKYVRHSAGVTRKPLPIGISDYVRAQADYYYVDKTMLIKEFLDQKPLVSLFTRPRRFGKTLNMDMLRVFFEISEENTSKYFEDKAIWQCGEEYRNQQGQYPVVFLTFKDVKFDSWKATLDKIRDLLQEEFGRHQELATSERIAEYEKTYFAKIINGDASEVDLTASLAKLSQMLTKAYLVPCEFQKEMVVDPKNRLSWGEKNAFSLVRLLFERVEGTLSLLRKKYPAACKFVNETNHVENDYIYQLDPRKYFGIPNYYLQQIENFIQENKETILAGNILTENTELDQIGDN